MEHPVLSLYDDVMIYFYTYFLQICIRWRFWFERKPHQIDRSSDVYGNELGMRAQVSEVALFHILLDLILLEDKVDFSNQQDWMPMAFWPLVVWWPLEQPRTDL